jgi:diphthamide synthase (EF-2-diphthine--ammonia ligase)
MAEFLSCGFQTVTCCVNDGYLGVEWVGRVIDEQFLLTLPAEIDPCGENGEFHSFAFAGPVFSRPIPYSVGEKVYRALEPAPKLDSSSTCDCPQGPGKTKGFWFCDLLPV